MQDPPTQILNRWDLSNSRPVADTGHAQIWQVRLRSGEVAALKHYQRNDRGNEASGTRLMKAWKERGVVSILCEEQNVVLMEWLEGPTLGDIARAGQPEKALSLFTEATNRLHQTPIDPPSGLRPLSQVFEPLFDCQFKPNCAPQLRKGIEHASEMARQLLSSQNHFAPLHGDLHPDNVILTDTGTRVFDAKGYVGDPAFELANALRHPKGMHELVRNPEQINNCLTQYSAALKVSRKRLTQWAAAKCALSVVYRGTGGIGEDAEADLLDLLLNAADQ